MAEVVEKAEVERLSHWRGRLRDLGLELLKLRRAEDRKSRADSVDEYPPRDAAAPGED